jgi:hypothetical protein
MLGSTLNPVPSLTATNAATDALQVGIVWWTIGIILVTAWLVFLTAQFDPLAT